MQALQIAQTVKAVSLKSLVLDMKPGEEKAFPIKNDQSVRSAISASIKDEYPEREYTTKRAVVLGQKVLMVIRLK